VNLGDHPLAKWSAALDHKRFEEVNRVVEPVAPSRPSRVLRRSSAVLGVLSLTLLSAHVAPAVDDNNRYLKLTPLGDRLRLAYTVFYGEIPGAGLRRELDINHDGQVDDLEARSFGEHVGAAVAERLALTIDGGAVPIVWSTIDVGLGTPDVDAGSFSVDLVAFACLPSPRGEHRVTFRDRYELEHPGETEVWVEASPGVTISRAHVGDLTDASFDFRFGGPGGPIASEGLDVVFVAGPRALVASDGKCVARDTPATASRVRLMAVLGAALASVALGAFGLIRARRRKPRSAGA
jgi:hypothetical protein